MKKRLIIYPAVALPIMAAAALTGHFGTLLGIVLGLTFWIVLGIVTDGGKLFEPGSARSEDSAGDDGGGS